MSGMNNLKCRSSANHVHPPYSHDLLTLRRALSEAKTCMVALQDIRHRLCRRIRTLQTRCTPLVLSDGLNRLPDEILAKVFEMGHNLSEDYDFSLTVSHVCHRFRAVALKTPSLWTRLYTNVAPPLTSAFISRAGRVNVDVTFSSKISWPRKLKPDTINKNLDILRPTADRWYRLRFQSMPSKSQMQSLPYQLSQLRHLECSEAYPEYLDIFASSMQVFKVFDIPPPSHRLRITAFDVTFGRSEDVREAVLALYEMKNLRNLSVTFDMCLSDGDESRFRPLDDDSDDEENKIEDRWNWDISLDTMSVTVKNFTDPPVVGQLYDNILIRSIARSSITLDKLSGGEDSVGFLYAEESEQIAFSAPFMSVRLSRCMDNYHVWESFDLLTRLLEFHRLTSRTIHIDSPLATFIDQRDANKSAAEKPWTYYSSLRHLQLKNCDQLCEWQLQAFADKLVLPEEGKGLQSLVIITCRGISEDFLLELRETMGNKLRWVL
ncbi:hypothetical protein BD410DRAFT_513226 [Rickenella mellea]|uniref:F-box domain-containing protein n=1 Tax=Rickenella mellea TaxID=50990 RepID=A0A4Y7PRN7_9AGAM|nr:hypothetical protein BD410DRAFT_513226 [Rickenella mellea]